MRLTDTMTAASIAHRFFVQGRTKLEIAQEFGISRFKVARILTAAQEAGLVRVEFDLPVPIDLELSEAVRTGYRLRRVLVLNRAQSKAERPELRRRIGSLAADLLAETATADDVIGLSWARSVNAMADAVRTLVNRIRTGAALPARTIAKTQIVGATTWKDTTLKCT